MELNIALIGPLELLLCYLRVSDADSADLIGVFGILVDKFLRVKLNVYFFAFNVV